MTEPVGTASTPYRVESFDDPRAFAGFADDWNRLAEPFRTVVLDHRWLMLDLDSYHRDKPFRLITVRDGDRLAAACVLIGWRAGPLLRWELVATDYPGSLVFAERPALEALLSALEALPEPVVLKGLLRDGDVETLLSESAVGRALRLFRKIDNVFSLSLDATWEDFVGSLPGRRRRHHRRKWRKAEERGAVVFRALAPDPAEAGPALERFFAIEDANWKGSGGTSVLARPEERAFIERYALAAAARGDLRLFFLEIGGRPAAGQLAVVYADRLWGMKVGYDDAFAPCSPGFLLDWEVLRHAFEAGLDSYEFMGKADPWEAFWNPDRRAYRQVRLYPLGAKGLVGLAVDGGAVVLRRIGWIRR